ncbi:hypothetical protein C942_03617 [Photobacterium marinum]|uniref:Uncharacterized protein n=1 Tax=Photobacterium marinum TaxID=1056511 RepID=L8J404_9GAMM|nr:hypothetical protein C942_03617 [Photobacterium marinum]
MSAWLNTFVDFFNSNSREIGVVMYAEGCREGWLQGEFYRQSSDQNHGK